MRRVHLSAFDPRPSTSLFDVVNPSLVWEPWSDMVQLHDRADYGGRLTSLGDQYIDMLGFGQRTPGWDFSRFLRPASGSAAAAELGQGYCADGTYPEEALVKLYDVHVGRRCKEPPTKRMIDGINDEDAIADEFARRKGVDLMEMPMVPHGVWVQDGRVHYLPDAIQMLAVSPDRVILRSEDPADDRVIVEIKRPEKVDPNKFTSYRHQIQFQMWCVDATGCYLVQGIPPEASRTRRWEMMWELVPRDYGWAYRNVAQLCHYVHAVREYRGRHRITYNRYLERVGG